MKNYAIILAAGLGSRMKVNEPKCMHEIIKKPMIQYINEAIDNSFNKIAVISKNHLEKFEDALGDEVTFAFQEKQLGTGNAVKSCLSFIKDKKGNTLIVPGDMPLVNKEELDDFFSFHINNKNDVSVITTMLAEPTNYGRIIRKNGKLVEVKEQNNATDDELLIMEVNTGIYCVKNSVLDKLIESDDLPDIIVRANKLELKIDTYISKNSTYYVDVNDFYTLSIVESKIKHYTNKKHLLNGVNIISPETVTIASNVVIDAGVTIYPNTFLTGNTRVFTGAVIGPDSEVHNSIIDENTAVRHSLVTDSYVGKNTTIGPFAHLRNNTHIGDNCRIGNYVEIKNSVLDAGTKVAHLTYIGDTQCGKNVNWGCGCVTVNYDGKYKHKTIIGDNVFIGCNTNLVAPLNIGNNVFIAAGSTITDDIPDEAFSIARERQITKEDYARKYNYNKK